MKQQPNVNQTKMKCIHYIHVENSFNCISIFQCSVSMDWLPMGIRFHMKWAPRKFVYVSLRNSIEIFHSCRFHLLCNYTHSSFTKLDNFFRLVRVGEIIYLAKHAKHKHIELVTIDIVLLNLNTLIHILMHMLWEIICTKMVCNSLKIVINLNSILCQHHLIHIFTQTMCSKPLQSFTFVESIKFI